MTETSILTLEQLEDGFDSYKDHIRLDYGFVEVRTSRNGADRLELGWAGKMFEEKVCEVG
jgi:hypothetical protein